jgi:hypothetical protein
MYVAAAAAAAARNHDALAMVGQVCEKFIGLGVAHNGTERNRQDTVVAALAVLSRSLSVDAALGLEVPSVVVIEKTRNSGIRQQHHITAVPAISTVGTALGHMGFAAERRASAASVASFDVYFCLVYEHGTPANLSDGGRIS